MANTKTADLTTASALTGDELFYADDGSQDVKVSAQQIKDFSIQIPIEVGANVAIGYEGIFVGTVVGPNLNINSSAMFVGNATVNSTTLSVMGGIGNTSNIIANSSMVQVGNTQGIANLTPIKLEIGYSTVNSTAYKAGANVYLDRGVLSIGNTGAQGANLYANSSHISITNTTANVQIGPNIINVATDTSYVSLTTSTIRAGNTTANLKANSTMIVVSNNAGGGGSVAGANLQPKQLSIGNASHYTTIGGLGVTCAVVGSNTFNLGTSTATANGCTYLFNGILLQWGWVAANSSSGTVLFPVEFPNEVFAYQATANSAVVGEVYIHTVSSTGMIVRTSNTSYAGPAQNTFWLSYRKLNG